MSGINLTRREILTTSLAAAGVAAMTADREAIAVPAQSVGSPKRVVRLAHLTDVHVQAERAADEGFATALAHVQQQPDPPEFILFGGDNVMNVDSPEGAETADQQLAVWNRCLTNELSLPYYMCIGNHDILRNHAVDGIKWATDAYGLNRRYYHFDRSGWRFVVLDSTRPQTKGYKAGLDEEQFDWFKSVVEQTDSATSILVLSHIPILSASTFFDGENEKSGDWVVPGAWMHLDARAIKDFCLKHPNVRVSLSGHIHLVDEVRYNQVTYYCNGAVSAGWWKGPCQEFGNGYALIDLFDDGSAQRTFAYFPWQART
jgi:3',5'-cyclic-AMP phosphodiesterase